MAVTRWLLPTARRFQISAHCSTLRRALPFTIRRSRRISSRPAAKSRWALPRSSRRRAISTGARVYQANYCLRRMGLRPAAPGASRLRDELKYWAFARLAKSDPASWDELMYSGMHRLKAPARLALRTFKSAERALRIAIRGGPH